MIGAGASALLSPVHAIKQGDRFIESVWLRFTFIVALREINNCPNSGLAIKWHWHCLGMVFGEREGL
jgi:hypothetical protein